MVNHRNLVHPRSTQNEKWWFFSGPPSGGVHWRQPRKTTIGPSAPRIRQAPVGPPSGGPKWKIVGISFTPEAPRTRNGGFFGPLKSGPGRICKNRAVPACAYNKF